MRMLNKRLLRLIKESKSQYIAIAMVIIFGIMAYIAFRHAILNLETSVDYYYEENNFSDVIVQVPGASDRDVRTLSRLEGVKGIEGRIVRDVYFDTEEEEDRVKLRLISLTPENEVNSLYLHEGKPSLGSDDDIYLIDMFYDANGYQLGDTVDLRIAGAVESFRVAGKVSSPEFVYLMESEQSMLPDAETFGVGYIRESYLQNRLGLSGHYNEIVIDVEEGYSHDRVADAVEKELAHLTITRIYTRETQLSASMINEEIEGNKQITFQLPIIFLGVAAVILSVMISRIVKSDRMVIGIMKSMGYTNLQVLVHYMMLSVVIGFVGAVGGILFGLLVTDGMTDLYGDFFAIPYMTFTLRPQLILSSMALSLSFAVVSGVFGARKSMSIMPSEAMRPAAPKIHGKRTIFERFKVWKHIGFTNKIVIRNLLRNKGRVLFISMGIALTYAITLYPIFMWVVMQDMFFNQYENFMTMDYNISIARGANERAADDLAHDLNIKHVEPKVEYPFEIQVDHKTKVVSVVGLIEDTGVYHFTDTNRQAISLHPGDLFISENIALDMGIEPGDLITFNTYLPNREDQQLRVTDLIRQDLGANIYMPLDDMQEHLLEPGFINGFFIQTDRDIMGELEDYPAFTTIQTLADMRKVFEEFMGLMIASISTLILVGGGLGFVIVYNATIMTINQRRLEFSSLRVLGMSKNEIFSSLVKEKAVMTLIGILIGIPIAQQLVVAISNTMSSDLFRLDTHLPTWVHLVTAGLTILFVLIAQASSYWKINRLDFIEALKNRMS